MPHSPLLDKKGTMLPTPGGGVGGFDKAELYDDPGFATEQHHARPGEDDDYNMPFGEKGTEPERTKHGAAEGWLKGKEKFRKHLDEWGCHFLVAPNGDVQSSKETGATEHREMLTPVNWNKEKDGEYDWESAERDFFSQGGIEVHIGRILGKGYVEGVIRLGKFSPESVQRVNAIIDELPVKEVQVADLTSALISGEPRAVKGKLMRYVNSPAHLASRKCECHGFTESGEDKSVCTCGHQWHEHWHGGSLGCRFGKTAVGASGPSEPAFRAAQVLAQFGKIGETDVRRVAKGIDDLVSHMPVFSLSRGRPGAEAQPWAGKQAVSETPSRWWRTWRTLPPCSSLPIRTPRDSGKTSRRRHRASTPTSTGPRSTAPPAGRTSSTSWWTSTLSSRPPPARTPPGPRTPSMSRSPSSSWSRTSPARGAGTTSAGAGGSLRSWRRTGDSWGAWAYPPP